MGSKKLGSHVITVNLKHEEHISAPIRRIRFVAILLSGTEGNIEIHYVFMVLLHYKYGWVVCGYKYIFNQLMVDGNQWQMRWKKNFFKLNCPL